MTFKSFPFLLLTAAALAFTACEKEKEVIIDPTQPQGAFTAAESGSFVEQNATGTKGTAQLGTDEDGKQFLRFSSDFTTNLATGTVTVYLSTSDTYTADPANGNPDLRLIGPVSKAGENYFLLDPAAASKFNYVILWCASANIPFGYAALQ
ncbi:MAG: DM13 domain-containing protein [Saprospiraceae bacterium]|nr:DM13 domain-containing protein [Saprospiraceae bacterium]MCB0575156.1 DM13 domain-containing protein [Saprospiraceae bacterium]MCB9306633.1 DM13 domain-containing protein [Lewinellaceae bacterium]MCB9355230.1 DM13 domain-containing protein [Lewinellaceae bacterium]